MTDKKGQNKEDLRQAFFDIEDTTMEEIDLSKFNGPKGMFAKTISWEESQKIITKCTSLKEGVDPKEAKESDYELSDDFVVCFVAASVCDSEGNLIFSYDDVPAIQKKSKTVFEIVQNKVKKMNSVITENEVQEKEKK